MTKLSVIIPVYNTEKYLPKCLDSIFMQDFEDFEVICVDDGSTDNSLKILQKYPKINIIRKTNEGSGVARNIALSYAKGEYILFVDSDDWLCKSALKKIVSKADNLNTDILIFGGLVYFKGVLRKGSYSVNKIPSKYRNRIFNKTDFKKDIFKFPPTAWTKLYKKDFLDKYTISFQNIKVGQDQIFFIKSMLSADKIAVLDENLYCYNKRRAGSVTSIKEKTNFSPVYVFWAVNEFLKNCDYDYKIQILNKYFLKSTFWLAKMKPDLKQEYFNEYSKILQYLKNIYPKFWWRNFNPQEQDSYLHLKFQYWKCLLQKQFLLNVTEKMK